MKITQLKNINSKKIEKHSIKNSEIEKYSLINPKIEYKEYMYVSKYLKIEDYRTKFEAPFGFYDTESKIQYKKLNSFLFAWICRQRDKLKKRMQEQSKITNAINRIPKNQYILKNQYNNFMDNFKKIRQWAVQNFNVIKDYKIRELQSAQESCKNSLQDSLQNSLQVQKLKNEIKDGIFKNLPQLTDEFRLILEEIKKIETKPGLAWLNLEKWKNIIFTFYPEFCEIDVMIWDIAAYNLLLDFMNEFFAERYEEEEKEIGNEAKFFAVTEKFYDLWDKINLESWEKYKIKIF